MGRVCWFVMRSFVGGGIYSCFFLLCSFPFSSLCFLFSISVPKTCGLTTLVCEYAFIHRFLHG